MRAVTGARFGVDLYLRLAAERAGDVVCSPWSVLVALAMLAQGARGTTAQEILAALDAQDAGELATRVGRVEQALGQRTADLASAGSLWGQRGIRWEAAFLEVLQREFGAGLREVDYARTEEARLAINAWASERTHERIPEIIPEGLLTPASRLTLVNALYFKAAWATPFSEHATRPQEFHRLDGSVVTVPMMSGDRTVGHAAGPGWVAIDLPYLDDELAMAVVVADTGRFPELEQGLTGAWLSSLLTSFTPGRVSVGLPRWTTRSGAELRESLAALGIRAAFDPSAADFTEMTTQEPLFVSAALHESFVAVDEAGTEAAAVTALLMGRSAVPAPPPRTVVADRPFLYVVHDRPTGTPLFIGRVVDPGTPEPVS